VYRFDERARAGVGREVVEANLDADRAAASIAFGERGAQLADELFEDLLETARVGDVPIERRLARLRDDLALLGDGRLVLEAGAALKLGGEAQTEALGELLFGRCGELGERVDPQRPQPLSRLGADPGDQATRRRAEALAGLLPREHHEPAGLLRIG